MPGFHAIFIHSFIYFRLFPPLSFYMASLQQTKDFEFVRYSNVLGLSKLYGGLMYCVQSRSLGVCPTSRGLSCWGRSVTPCLWFRGGGGVSRVKGSARAPRLPGLIVLGGASVAPYLWARFQIQSMTAICRGFCSPERVINGSCGNYMGLCSRSGAPRAHLPLYVVYLAGRLQ